MAINKPSKKWIGPANSEQFLEKRNSAPPVSALMVKNISEFRKNALSNEVDNGLFKDGSGPIIKNDGLTNNSVVTSSIGFKKSSQAVSGSSSSSFNFRGPGDSAKQTPEVYSPLWLNSNLSLPRDRATINAWCRSFFALNPFVHNAISLHSTYPISKLNIKCPNKDIEKFFNDMIEEIDLMNICVQIAQEYWLLGESFVYAELDESKGKWSRLLIQNPDYMVVKRTVVASEPIIMLKPDENLKTVVRSNRPSDIEQRKQLNQHIIDSVRRGDNIPLNNFHVSHLARRISPYEIRGTGLPVCIFRQLMLFDKLRECHDDQTEILTDHGFKKIYDLLDYSTSLEVNPNNVNGASFNQDGSLSILQTKKDFKIACVNSDTSNIEYHAPIDTHISKYTGKMLHFTGKKVDSLVTPNHKMWVKEKTNNKWASFEKRPAISLLNKKKNYKFTSLAKFVDGKDIKYKSVCNENIPIELYLKVLGYLISEGCVYSNFKNKRYDALISVNQLTSSDCYDDMRQTFDSFANLLNKKANHFTRNKGVGYSKYCPKNMWSVSIHGKDIVEYFKSEIGTNSNTLSKNKRIPRWALELKPDLLSILLEALVKGDGTEGISKYGSGSKNYKYSTISKQLADDVYELVYKLGFVPNICVSIAKKSDDRLVTEYIVMWSDTNYGCEPNIMSTPKINNNGGGARIKEVDYDGVVWCFEVPTGLFITRRNGKIAIHGNSKFAQADNMINPLTLIKIGSEGADGLHPTHPDLEAWREVFESAQYDKDFKIFTHPGVTVERVGYGQGIYDISGDITQLVKEIYVGLMVPSVLMDGGADTTYANGGVALDVLRQRYMQFRNMLSSWLKRKIFAPISKIQGFYDYAGGEKQLIVPDVDWNHMSIFDAGDYINNLVTLTQGDDASKRASLHTLYRSLGLEYQDETRKIRKEAIQKAITDKEKASLATMDLNSLRALGEDDEIPEPQTEGGAGAGGGEALPGEAPLPGMPELGGPPPGGEPPPGGGAPPPP